MKMYPDCPLEGGLCTAVNTGIIDYAGCLRGNITKLFADTGKSARRLVVIVGDAGVSQ